MKTRYEVLDGLRGTAALSVVALHLCEVFRPTAELNPLHHGYLAVDFFYMLSGFVMGHAYDSRWPQMGRKAFFLQRLRRLHPLVVLGAALGLAGYLLGELVIHGRPVAPMAIALNLALGLLLLPGPSLTGREGATHSLNGPSWSLGQEYLANIAYALVGRRLGHGALAAVVVISGAALLAIGAVHGTLHLGWSWSTVWAAPVRTAFPFFTGLLLHRIGARMALPGAGWAGLSLVLLAVFFAPHLADAGGLRVNGIVEAALVIALFPLVIAAGAASQVGGRMGRLCRLSGEISYPIYIIHYPLVRLYADWVWAEKPPHAVALAAGVALAGFVVIAARLALKLYDEPLRRWFAARRPQVVAEPSGPAAASASTASPG